MSKDTGVVKRAIATPDKHFPLADMPAIKALCSAIDIVQPDIYIDLGDVGEWSAFSHWKWKRKKAPPLEYLIKDFDKDVKDVNKGMDIIDEALDKTNCRKSILLKEIMMTGLIWLSKSILTFHNTNLLMPCIWLIGDVNIILSENI